MSFRHNVLPNREGKQNGWEDKVDKRIRNEDNAEKDDNEGQRHQGRVDDGSMSHLFSLESDIKTQEDGFQQPSNIDDETCAHLYEIALDSSPYHHYNDGEKRDSNHKDKHPFPLLKVWPSPFLRQKPTKDNVAYAKRESKIEDEENADEEYGCASPFRVELSMSLERVCKHGRLSRREVCCCRP